MYERTNYSEAIPSSWKYEADVVIAGAGAAGIAAAVEAADQGASVILIDENFDVGGHALINGGNIFLGGGSSLQKKLGIKDSPDLLFSDLTNFKKPGYRFNDRDIARAFADNSGPTCDWLIANGVKFYDGFRAYGYIAGEIEDDEKLREYGDHMGDGESVPRRGACLWHEGSTMQSPGPINGPVNKRGFDKSLPRSGAGLIRPLEASARSKGVQILLEHKLRSIFREAQGRVLGITATHQDHNVNIRANKGVIIATGGHSSNVNFRRMFDPRLTEEYNVNGEPWSYRTGDGEISAIAIGAALWSTANQTIEWGAHIEKRPFIGCRYSLGHKCWEPGSAAFARARASGLFVADYQNVILVNQIGQRFWNELDSSFDFINAALAPNGGTSNGGGPIWAVFDSDAARRENWTTAPPYVDFEGYFFSANTIAELAGNIQSTFQKAPIPPRTLEATVSQYNSYVEDGADRDFSKPSPKYKIEKAPFFAAWATPVLHDSRTGLRINAKCQVLDMTGIVIPGLYCAGESAGGLSQHGMGRCIVQGRISARNAV